MRDDPRVLIDTGPGLTRALLFHGSTVIEAWQDQAHAPDLVGSIHKVRVDRVFADQGRALARLADGTPVSLRIGRHDSVVAGHLVTITIMAAPREGKPWQAVIGARLVGCDLVLLPGQTGIAMSRHLAAEPDATVMAAIRSCLADAPEFGVILRRTASRNDDLPAACRLLIAQWRQMAQPRTMAGCVFDGGGLEGRIRRQLPGISIDETGPDSWVQFDTAWDQMIGTVCDIQVPLAGGGRMWIEATRALTAIDLDSGDGDLEALFAAAPAAITSQLRLRQTGGLVAIDLPRMSPATRKRVDADLAAALATDPRHPEWIGRSRAGMIELGLPHGRAAPAGYEADQIAISVLAVLREIARRPTIAAPVIDLSPDMADWLRGPGAAALASLDRTVTPVVSSQALTATLREPL
ncbi:ribonuclease E/G [Alphaproteobacteria bacterium LSUCC0719]